MDEHEERPDIYLKDASDGVKQFLKAYWEVKLGIDLPISAFEVIFGDETHTWEDFQSYKDIRANENISLDTSDREILNSWLWARVQGEEFPYMMSDEDMEEFITKISRKDLLDNLYKRSDVYSSHLQRTDITKKLKFNPKNKPLPEIIP